MTMGNLNPGLATQTNGAAITPANNSAANVLSLFSNQESFAMAGDFRPVRYTVDKTGFVSKDGDRQPEFTGVILAIRKTRAHLITDPSGQVVVECRLVKIDPVNGDKGQDMNNQIRACATCPYNNWRSAQQGEGKACREKRLILFLPDGWQLPITITAPPTSIRDVDSFTSRMWTQRKALPTQRVRLRVHQRTKAGITYGVIGIEELGPLTERELEDLAARVTVVQTFLKDWMEKQTAQLSEEEAQADDNTDENNGTAPIQTPGPNAPQSGNPGIANDLF